MSQRDHPLMDQEFFANLPSEIVIHILGSLPVRSIIICKCVCKSWLSLLGTHDFAKFHLSRSVPSLAVCQTLMGSYSFQNFEFEDDLDLEHHELHYRLVTKFAFPGPLQLHGSANGFLCLGHPYSDDALYIFNPITRDFIQLDCPKEHASYPQEATYGFGTSKITSEHKVVRISNCCYPGDDMISDEEMHEFLEARKPQCHVYTLGKGSWRHIAPGDSLIDGDYPAGVFVNGNLHWLKYNSNGSEPLLSCFDLETELFSSFSCPCQPGSRRYLGHLSALGDSLCYCDNTLDDGIVIWLMKEYGAEKSWTRVYVTHNFLDEFAPYVYPIKVFKDGDILMACDQRNRVVMFCYSTKTKATRKLDMFQEQPEAILYTPSFLSLKNFGLEVMNLIDF